MYQELKLILEGYLKVINGDYDNKYLKDLMIPLAKIEKLNNGKLCDAIDREIDEEYICEVLYKPLKICVLKLRKDGIDSKVNGVLKRSFFMSLIHGIFSNKIQESVMNSLYKILLLVKEKDNLWSEIIYYIDIYKNEFYKDGIRYMYLDKDKCLVVRENGNVKEFKKYEIAVNYWFDE